MSYPTSPCRSCGAPIIWAVTGSGAREPIDAEPVADGNIEFNGATAVENRDGDWETVPTTRHLKKGEAESPTLFEPPLMRSEGIDWPPWSDLTVAEQRGWFAGECDLEDVMIDRRPEYEF